MHILTVNLAARSPRSALCQDFEHTEPVQMPDLTISDTVPIFVKLADGTGSLDAWSGDSTCELKVAIGTPGAVPTAGTYRLTFSGQQTSALAYNADAAAIQAALQALSTIGTGNVLVTGTWPNFIVEFTGAKGLQDVSILLADASALMPASSVAISTTHPGTAGNNEKQAIRISAAPLALCESWTVTPGVGWYGVLNLATNALAQTLGQSTTLPTWFEVQLTEPGGNVRTIAQVPCTVLNEAIGAQAFAPGELANAYTTAETDARFAQNRSDITGLTGGGTTNLDSIPTVSLDVGRLVAVRTTANAGMMAWYRLEAGTDAESSPTVIRPDDYNASTNAKVWKLSPTITPSLSVATAAPARQQATIGSYLDIYSGSANAPSVQSIRAESAGHLNLNAYGSGELRVNFDTGTGGVRIYNGAGSEIARALATGIVFTHAGLAHRVPGRVAMSVGGSGPNNTTTETSLFGTIVGSLTIPGSFWSVGKIARLSFRGRMRFANAAHTLALKLKAGSTTLASTAATALGFSFTSDRSFELKAEIACSAIDTNAYLLSNFQLTIGAGAAGANPICVGTTTTGTAITIPYADAAALDFTAQFGTADANSLMLSALSVVEIA